MLRTVLVFFSVLLLSGPAIAAGAFTGGEFAPTSMRLHPQSGKEALLLSFYRNTDKTPDFRKWSYQTDKALEAQEYDRRVVALNEQVRLQTAYENTDPSGFLVIHAPIDVSQYSATQEILFMPGFNHGGTLAQDVYGEKMAMVIPELAQFRALSMNNEQAGPFYRALSQKGRTKTISDPVVAEMIVKPRRAIMSKAGRVGKNDTYLFYLDLAQMTFWRTKGKEGDFLPLWTWRADWYKPESDNADLLQLYKAIN